MPNEVFQLTTVTRPLGENVELAEALGFPELSALDDAERKWRATLQAKAKAILADADASPPLSLHRRRIGPAAEADGVEMTFEPPKRSPLWQEPVTLRVPFVRWAEEDLHQAYVPAFGVLYRRRERAGGLRSSARCSTPATRNRTHGRDAARPLESGSSSAS